MAKKTAVLRGMPHPKQIEFFESRAKHTAYGGARGGGKSWAMRRKFVLLASKYDGLRLLLLRRTLQELNENHIQPLLAELAGIANYNQTQRVFTFPKGSRIRLGYCDAENDAYQYQGQEYDVVGFEEATRFSQNQMQYIATCCRTTRTDFSPRLYYTCNPGGVGHDYIKRLFIDRRFEDGEDPADYYFIQAKVTDNPSLVESDPSYIRTLQALPEDLRRANMDGDWDVVEGQYFREFRRDRHVVQPFPIPDDWKRFRAMDWGYNDPCCVLWFAMSPDRRVYVYREIYQSRTLSSDMARLILQQTGFEHVSYTVASPDAWAQRGIRDAMGGESVAEVFARSGVPIFKADNSRVAGWQRCRENFSDAPDGMPYVQIFDCCVNLIRTLPLLSYDKHDHEDVSDNCEDHAAEALRYGLMSRPSPAAIKKPSARILAYDPLYIPKKRVQGGFFSL